MHESLPVGGLKVNVVLPLGRVLIDQTTEFLPNARVVRSQLRDLVLDLSKLGLRRLDLLLKMSFVLRINLTLLLLVLLQLSDFVVDLREKLLQLFRCRLFRLDVLLLLCLLLLLIDALL